MIDKKVRHCRFVPRLDYVSGALEVDMFESFDIRLIINGI